MPKEYKTLDEVQKNELFFRRFTIINSKICHTLNNVNKVIDSVNIHISEGWQPLGSITVSIGKICHTLIIYN